ncbi:MAG: winged helix-turn-helix transcriptional regulator [Nanoarchaeota archaeon]|nr:winged helix-turn-helix transcriptional regulator [Nanoarchaeota archaeon]
MNLTKTNQTNGIFQIGSRFPDISGASLCLNGKEELNRLKIKSIKFKIKKYLKTHKKISIASLSEDLDIPPKLIGRVLNELEDEGIIKESD